MDRDYRDLAAERLPAARGSGYRRRKDLHLAIAWHRLRAWNDRAQWRSFPGAHITARRLIGWARRAFRGASVANLLTDNHWRIGLATCTAPPLAKFPHLNNPLGESACPASSCFESC